MADDFFASGLTLFSAFGLGTLLMPVAAIFLPVPIAVAVTAIVHLSNKIFKLALLWRDVGREVLLTFGLPAGACRDTGSLFAGQHVEGAAVNGV